MQHKTFRLILCGIFLILSACAPQPAPTPTPVPFTATVVPPTATPLPPTATSTPAPTPITVSAEAIAGIDTLLKNLTSQDLFTGSVLIAQGDTVLLNKGYGLADRKQKISNTPKTRFIIASITKQFTAMAILILESQGKLQISDRLCKYYTECPTAWQDITIDELLTHTSGIPDYISLENLGEFGAPPATLEQTIAHFKNLPLAFKPGEKFSYSNSGYIMLGYIIEKVSGQSYGDFLRQHIFTPLNMRDTDYDPTANSLAVGYPDQYSMTPAKYIDPSATYSAGGLYSTVEDLYIWQKALLTEKLVPQASHDKMFARHVAVSSDNTVFYGYGWFMDGISSVWHSGSVPGFAGIIVRTRNDNISIVILGNQTKDIFVILDAINKKLYGK